MDGQELQTSNLDIEVEDMEVLCCCLAGVCFIDTNG